MILLLLISAALIEAAVIAPRMIRLSEMCRRRCRLLFDFNPCGATFCNEDGDCHNLFMSAIGHIELMAEGQISPRAQPVPCTAADEYVMAHQEMVPIYPVQPLQNGNVNQHNEEEDDDDSDLGSYEMELNERQAEVVSYVTEFFTKLTQGCVLASIVSFPARPLVCTRRRDMNSDIEAMQELVDHLYVIDHSVYAENLDLSVIRENVVLDHWQLAMGLLVAVLLNNPDLPTSDLNFGKLMLEFFNTLMRFTGIFYDDEFNDDVGIFDDLAHYSKLTVPLDGVPVPTVNVLRDELERPDAETKERIWQFLTSFVANKRTNLDTDKTVCETIAIRLFDYFKPLSDGLKLEEKSLLSEFASTCAQYVEFDRAVLLQSINSFQAYNCIGYPDAVLTVNDGANFFAIGLAKLRGLTKLHFVNENSPAVRTAGRAATGNGPRIEWQGKMVREAFAARDLFVFSDERHMFYKPKDTRSMLPSDKSNYLEKLHQIGRLIGMGLRDHITLEISFTPAAVALLSGLQVTGIHDSKLDAFWAAEDPEHRSNVLKLKTELPAGTLFDDDQTMVTEENLQEYIEEVRDEKLFSPIMEPMKFIRNGIYDVLPYGALDTYSVAALSELLRGIVVIDVEELISKFRFYPPAFEQSTDVAALLETLRNYTQADLRRFLQFVVGSPLPPATGIPTPWLKIQAATYLNANSLPMSKTCFKILLLPHYHTQELLAARLNYAILHTTTMELV